MFRTSVIRSATASAARLLTTRAASKMVTRPTLASQVAKTVAAAAPRLPGFTSVRFYAAAEGGSRKDEVEGRIMQMLAGFDKVNDANNIKPTAHFANDLGLDSLDTVEVVMAIEEEFSIEIPDKDADKIHSVEQAVEYIINQPDAL